MVQDAQLMMVSLPSRIWWLTLKTMVLSSPVAGAEMTTRLAPAFRWASAFSLSVKKPVHSRTTSTLMFFPGNFGGVLLSVYFYFVAVDDDGVLGGFYFFFKAALCAVIFQQVSQYFRTGQVINCHYVYSVHSVDLAESQTSDPAETIDSNFNCAHNDVKFEF